MMGRAAITFVSCAIYVSAILAAATARAVQAEHRHRVLGLFQSDREDDLRQVVQGLQGIEVVAVDYETGEATFRYDAAEIFPGKNTPEQIVAALDQLLRGASRSTFEIAPLTGMSRKQLQKVEIGIVGLDCKGCSYAAYLAVYKTEGVENATASFKQGKVSAWIDPESTNRTILVEALKAKRIALVPEDTPDP